MVKESHVKKEKGKRVEKASRHLTKRYDGELTMARSLFRDIKRSGCLMHLRASMSFGKRRGYFKVSAT